jgi:hypothetical protein
MTISSTVRVAGPFIGNGTASVFSFTFKVFSAADLDVIRLATSTGVETTLVLNSDYSVSLNGDQNSNPGGSITMLAGALATGFTLTITSDIANLQPTDLTNQGGFYPEVITDSLDRATIQIQQISDIGDRTLKIPISDGTGINMELPTAAVRANSFLSFDANGEPTVVTAGSSGAPATITRQVFSGTGSQTVFTLASDPGALGNSAQVYIGGVYQQRSTYTIAGTTLTFSAAPVAGTNNIEFVNFLTSNIGATSADLVTYTPAGSGAVARSAASKFGDVVSVKDFGAVGDGVADDTAAITAAFAAVNAVMFPTGTYRITSTIAVTGGKYIESSNAVINKDFNGVGLAFTGGSTFNYVTGTLSVVGVGTFASNTASPSANPSAHGITITNNRVIVDGSLISNNNQGNGVLFTSSGGNSNRCVLTDIRCTGNGVNGIRFSGTSDNAAVWKVGFYCTGNREAGIYFDNDFIGRSWNGFVYCESNAVDGTSDQLYFGKLRNSSLFIYAEEGVSTGAEITIGANCQFLDLVDTRESGSVNNASLTCRLSRGNKLLAVGDTTHYGYVDCVNLTNNSAKYADLIYETSEGTIGFDRIRGNRQLERYVVDPSTNVATSQQQGTSFVEHTTYGNVAINRTVGANGTLSAPTAKSVSEVVLRQAYAIQTAASTRFDAASMRLEATSIGSGNKASGNLIWATTANGASSQTDSMQLTEDGNFEILQSGKGIRLRQPDGTVRLLTVNNAGALVIT